MNDNDINDDIQFDRLVDGDLRGNERRLLLESLDSRPDGWRRCALAFLEAQSWGVELGEIVRPNTVETEDANVGRAEDSTNGRTNLRTAARWLALAAAVMVAFTLGLTQRNRTTSSSVGPSPTNGQVTVISPPPGMNAPNDLEPDDTVTLWVRDDAGQARPLRVPLVDADPLDQQLGTQFQSGVPTDLRNHLQDHGFQVQSKQRYAPLWFEDGRPMFVPVEDTKIVPVRENVF